mmetsp:Transcript_100/g.327  ORF Transcript_100/g.327 Transcript_100/m.327 type:complete len:1277 (-) Transcript_100:593-4423(-)
MKLLAEKQQFPHNSAGMKMERERLSVAVEVQAFDPSQVSGGKDPHSHIVQHDHSHANGRLHGGGHHHQFSSSKSGSAASHPQLSFSCFLCGRNFGTRSLGTHLPQCLQKWELTEALLPLDEQRTHPTIPKEFADPINPAKLLPFKDGAAEGILPTEPKEVDNFNRAMSELARKNWQSSSAPPKRGSGGGSGLGSNPTPHGSKVLSHHGTSYGEKEHKKDSALARLAKFAFGGSMPSFAKRQSDHGATGDSSAERIPKAYVCYLCGQQFGAKSLGIHLHHCNRQRELQNLKLPHPRPVLPLPPKELADPDNPVRLCAYQDGGIPDGVLPTNEVEIRAFNMAMTEYWRAGLPKCLHCKTVFLPEQLPEHQPTCSMAAPSQAALKGPNAVNKSAVPSQDPAPAHPQAGGSHPYTGATSYAAPSHKHQSRGSNKNSRLQQAQAILRVGGFRHYRCYLCEEKFPGTVLKAHCMECKRAWVKAEEVLADGMRRLLPPPPPEMRLILTGQAELPVDPSDVAAFNAAMAAHWEATSLLRCSNCRGCFRPQTFVKEHGSRCMLASVASDDTTVSMGWASPAVLTPPVTREVARPRIVPELMLSAIGLSKPSRKQLQEKAAQQQKQKKVPSQKDPTVKATLTQAAATLQAAENKKSSKASASNASVTAKKPSAICPLPSAKKKPASPASKIAAGWGKSSSKKATASSILSAAQQPAGHSASHAAGGSSYRKQASRSLADKRPTAPTAAAADKRASKTASKLPAGSSGASAMSRDITPPPHSKLRAPTPPKGAAGSSTAATSSHSLGPQHSPHKMEMLSSTASSADSKVYGGGSHMYACYLCGQHYHYHSYHMHIGQCIRKWEKVQTAIPDAVERVVVPPAPERLLLHSCLPTDANAVKAFNEDMRLHREKYAMRHCDNCSKMVSLMLWSRHTMHCLPQQAQGDCHQHTPHSKVQSIQGARTEAARKPGLASRGRLAYTCYICANSFNASKYHSHVEGCRKRFEREAASRGLSVPPKPTLEHKRLPVQPEHVEAFNQRMLELHDNINMSQKLSHSQATRAFDPMSVTAKEVLNEFMGQHGSKLESGHTTPDRHTDSFDGTLFTPLPTGPGMQKGDVMVSCRHCGRIVSEAELFIHATSCALCGGTHSKPGSRPPTQRSHRHSHRHSHRASRGPDEPMLLVRANSSRLSRRATAEEASGAVPGASPTRQAAPTICETMPTVEPPQASLLTEAQERKAEKEHEEGKKGGGKSSSKFMERFAAFGRKLKKKFKGRKHSALGSTTVTVTAI